jgi:hypothetical protein
LRTAIPIDRGQRSGDQLVSSMICTSVQLSERPQRPGRGRHSDAEKDVNGKSGGGGGGKDTDLNLDAPLIALLKKIPTDPSAGWPGPSRVRWFRTFAMNVSQIYDGDGEPVEMKIELEKTGSN